MVRESKIVRNNGKAKSEVVAANWIFVASFSLNERSSMRFGEKFILASLFNYKVKIGFIMQSLLFPNRKLIGPDQDIIMAHGNVVSPC